MGDISKDINTTFTSEKVKALINIKFTSGWLEAHDNDLLKPFNISVQQYNILRILRGAGKKITVQTIKERMIERSPNATRLMDKLCAKGFIERFRSEADRRAVYVSITPEGLKVIDDINIESKSTCMDRISDEEAQILNRILDKLR